MNKHAKKIAKLRAQLARLEKMPTLKPTGRFNIIIKNDKGRHIYTMEGYESRTRAKAESDKMWRILVDRLKQKATFSVRPEYKKV